MDHYPPHAFAFLAAFQLLQPSLHSEEVDHICNHQLRFLAPATSPDHRKYAPARLVDFIHLRLEFTPSFTDRTVQGTTTLQFKPIAQPVQVLALDAIGLDIEGVEATRSIEEWHLSSDQLIVHFKGPLEIWAHTTLTIHHSAEPEKGLYFRTPEMGYRSGETHLFTQGEAIESRHWFPCFDAPNEKLTTEVICYVPDGMTVLSNGRKLSEQKDESSGLVRFHWLQDKPHVNYLIAVVAGYFKSIHGQYRDIPMAFYTLPSQIHMASNSYAGTEDMMEFMEEETGIPYPWDQYNQVTVNDFVAGGMENTTLTILTDGTLFDQTTETLRSSQDLVAHELAHQWFGDLVTCKDWSQIWLNEGFATYFEALYRESQAGQDEFRYAMLKKMGGWLNNPNDPVAIVHREYDRPMQQFGYRAYPKGAWVLHMIRSKIGATAFRRMMKTFLERHRYQSVDTADLAKVLEDLTGTPFDQFFDQWVYHGGHPDLSASFHWDSQTKMARLTVQQKQKPTDHVLLFRLPLTVRFKGRDWTRDVGITVDAIKEDFYFSLPRRPEIVRLDPDFTTLMRAEMKIPQDMLLKQANDATDIIGQILAIRALGKKDSKQSIELLGRQLTTSTFYGVRIEASKALGSLHSERALSVLLAATEQSDPRVFHQVLSDVSRFYDPQVRKEAMDIIEHHQNPIVQATAITSLAPYQDEHLKSIILNSLRRPSFQERVAGAAISVIGDRAEAIYVAPLMEYLMTRPDQKPASVMSQGLTALAKAAHELDDRTLVREFLVSKTSHPRNRIRNTAIRALGTLGDPRAIPILRRLASGHADHPDRRAAQSSLDQLRKIEPPNRQLKHLQDSITDLERNESTLEDRIETLEKQLKALRSKETLGAAENRSETETH